MDTCHRRTFLKLMGALTAIFCTGRPLTAKAQTTVTDTKKRFKRIGVEEHCTWKEYEVLRKSGSFATGGGTMGMGGSSGIVPTNSMSATESSQDTFNRVDFYSDLDNVEHRLKDMDDAGIDMQVLSSVGGVIEQISASEGLKWARESNERIAQVVDKYPDRFAGFARIPWQDPDAAVKELERAVKDLGLHGIKLNTHKINGEYLDHKMFWPIYKKAEELDTPIFLHIGGGSETSPLISGQSDIETSLYCMRMINSGLFDEYPRLKIINGHMGAGLPFWIGRMSRGGTQGSKKGYAECVKENFYTATSGNFYMPALMCCYMAVGADNILFGVDYPPDSNYDAIAFMDSAPICDSDKEKIYHLNAERIFHI